MAASLNAFELIDRALARYYVPVQVHNYFNEDGRGKFLEDCEVNEFADDAIDDELDDQEQRQFIFDLLGAMPPRSRDSVFREILP